MPKPTITFRGLALDHTRYGWATLTGWEEGPPFDSGNVLKPVAHGAWPGPQWAQTRTIGVEGLSVRATSGTIGAACAALEAALPVDAEESPLVVDLDERGPLMALARPVRRHVPVGRTYRAGFVNDGAVQWEASDPRRYQLTEEQAPTANLCPEDPHMIVGAGRWYCTNSAAVGQVSHDPTVVHDGMPTARVTLIKTGHTGTLNVMHPDKISSKGISRWRVAAWCKHDHPGPRALRIALRCYDAAGKGTFVYGPAPQVQPGRWGLVWAELDVPAGTEHVLVSIEGRAGWPATGLGFWWTGVTVTPAVVDAELVADPSFAKGTGTWDAVDNSYAVMVHDTGRWSPGSQAKMCLQVLANKDCPTPDDTDNWDVYEGGPGHPVKPGEEYRASAFLCAESGPRKFAVGFRWKTTGGDFKTAPGPWFDFTNLVWTDVLSQAWTAPEDAVLVWVQIFERTPFKKTEAYFVDEVHLHKTGEQFTVTNTGTAPVLPLIEFYGPLTAPSLIHVQSGRRLDYDCPVSAGDALIVDCARGTVRTAKGIDRADTASWQSTPEELFVLPPGRNTFTSPNGPSGVHVRWRAAHW